MLGVVAAGGALGATARYAATLAWPTGTGAFPWTVFAVNVSGCALIGVLMVLTAELSVVTRPPGRVPKVPPVRRRTVAVLSRSRPYVRYRGAPAPCDPARRTPPGPPSGRPAPLSKHALVRPFLGVGVLGGFTTFSTYAADVSKLLQRQEALTAVAYAFLTPAAALGAVWVSAVATRKAVSRARGSEGGAR